MLSMETFATAILQSSRLYPILGLLPEWAARFVGKLVAIRYERYVRVCQALEREAAQ